MLVIGLTGSAAMGKSTVAAMFAARGVAVFDADRAVHRLYSGAAAPLIESAFPRTVAGGVVDRVKLGAAVLGRPEALARVEAIVHPLVREAESAFRSRAAAEGRRMALIDVPLLLETGGERRVDLVIVVSAPAGIQRERLLARPAMNPGKVDAILARQMPDADKRRRAHFIVDTGASLSATEAQIEGLMPALAGLAAGR